MAATETLVTQDPLGLQTFALTEPAYDLVNTPRGTYGRLSHAERQRPDADQLLINSWQNRSKEIGRMYQRLNGGSLLEMEEFIKGATAEWHQLISLETERTVNRQADEANQAGLT